MHSSLLHNHITEAWKLTLNGQKIRRFNFIGSFLDTLILSITLIWQIGYIWLEVLGQSSAFFSWVRNFWLSFFWDHRATVIWGVIIIGFAYFLVNFLIKNIFNAGLVHLIRAYLTQNERQYHTMPAFVFGWRKSIKLAEYHTILFWSKPVYIVYIFFWGFRFLDANWTIIISAAVIFWVILFITRLLFEYARYYIITEDTGVFEALWLSLTMGIENITITLRIFISLIFVYVREIILIAGIFFLPFIVSWLIALGLSSVFLQGVLIVIGLVYFIFLIIVSAMNSVIEVFVESLWYSVFRSNLQTSESQAHHGHSHSNHH